MKLFLTLIIITATTASFANPLAPSSVKDRLRLLLWTEGLGKDARTENDGAAKKPRLPEEIEKPLLKF